MLNQMQTSGHPLSPLGLRAARCRFPARSLLRRPPQNFTPRPQSLLLLQCADRPQRFICRSILR